MILVKQILTREEGRGYWTGNYTGTQNFITTLSYLLGAKL